MAVGSNSSLSAEDMSEVSVTQQTLELQGGNQKPHPWTLVWSLLLAQYLCKQRFQTLWLGQKQQKKKGGQSQATYFLFMTMPAL